MIIGIVAIDKNFAIGKDGKLPWHHPADLRFFKETTIRNTIVMGANTWRAIGKPLPDRLNVVITASNSVTPPAEVMRLAEKSEVLELARYLYPDVYIIGGARTYAAFADVIEKWIVTCVPDDVSDADTFMPRDFLDGFRETHSNDIGEGCTVKTLVRQ